VTFNSLYEIRILLALLPPPALCPPFQFSL